MDLGRKATLESPSDLLWSAAREARAVVRLATLLPLDWRTREARHLGVDDVVLLVHGTMASAGAWRPLRARLETVPRLHASAFSYAPLRGVSDVAELIEQSLSGLPSNVRVHLVGHSLGGLAVRWFVQEAEDPRVVQTISVAAPFQGARGAAFLPGRAGRDMRAGSAALSRLHETARRPSIPHLSIFGTADTAVDPSTSFPVGERLVVSGAGHNALLFHQEVGDHVLGRVQRLQG